MLVGGQEDKQNATQDMIPVRNTGISVVQLYSTYTLLTQILQ